MDQIHILLNHILNSFLHIWPYLLVTIPVSVGLRVSGISGYITRIFMYKPLVSILLATLIGAVSPFCSCGVIPVITSLLIGGVPVAPVMSFWIASPSMDPEIFFLSVSTIGWKLSVWRLAATFLISLSAGLITHILTLKGFLGDKILRERAGSKAMIKIPRQFCCISAKSTADPMISGAPNVACLCSVQEFQVRQQFYMKLLKETWNAVVMIVKFMSIAFFINAFIEVYVPKDAFTSLLAGDNMHSVIISTLIGIPLYTSNMTALPLLSGMLSLGMNQGAALAFLIAGPVTTLPAMMAVVGIVRLKVFILYLAYIFSGALIFGYLYNFIG